MIGGVAQRLGQLAPPLRDALAFARIDQIERDAAEIALGQIERSQRFIGRMHSPERLETLIVERLHSKRKPIDAGRRVAGEALRLDGCRIGFERDLDIGIDTPKRGDAIEDRCDRLRSHQRRRAAAEEDAGDGAPRREVREAIELAQIGSEETLLLDPAMTDMCC